MFEAKFERYDGLSCDCEVGLISMHKKDKRLRLILDGRHAGHFFDPLEGVELPSGPAIDALEVD